MAYVATHSATVIGAVAGQNILEGRAVVLSASGLHEELPTAMLATAGARNIFVAIVPPDNFPRPTPEGFFRRPGYSIDQLDPRDAVEFSYDTGQRGPYYRLGPSMMETPTALSGFMIQCHNGGTYTLTSGSFTNSAQIRVPGAQVRVGANGVFEYSTNASEIVGFVREYRDGRLTVTLTQFPA